MFLLPAVLEVMRMNRVCRMVLVTSVGSFILVIFYFQSMLLPGRALPLRSLRPVLRQLSAPPKLVPLV
uniref:Carbohydrate sulfotransferase n=1 Tax=Meleagris gallopavo TaxID=9103 RepID=A0A803YSE3_MELGA